MLSRVRPSKTPAFWSVGCRFRASFEKFCGLAGLPYGVDLPVPTFEGTGVDCLASVKRFCSGMLCGRVHLWHSRVNRLSRSSRMSIAMSLFLFRKVLPSSEADIDAYAQKLGEESPDPDPDFVKFCMKTVQKIFPYGWDRCKYPSSCISSTLPVSACVQVDRASGGCRMAGLSRGNDSLWSGRESFLEVVLYHDRKINLLPSQLLTVETGGKQRIVSKSDVDMNLLRPLHSSIYNHLTGFSWCLRGDAKVSRFGGFEATSGEIFVSGDYESATDNLNQKVQRLLLDLVLQQCSSVPPAIQDLARTSMSSTLHFPLEKGEWPEMGEVQQRSGQLMGNLLSFPLLCLVNYLCFKWLVPRKGVPVRINGDDIVFRSRPEEYNIWKEGVTRSGLVLSEGKTMVDSTYFSLNSTLFQARRSKVKLVPMLRSTAFGFSSDCGGIETLRGRFNSFCPGFYGSRRSELRIEWIKWNRKWIFASGRSLTRGLGLSVTRDEVVRTNLWDRESWYLSLPVERPVPLRLTAVEQRCIPEGFVLKHVSKITKEMRLLQEGVSAAFIEAAWSPVSLDVDRLFVWERKMKETSWWWPRPHPRDLSRRARLLRLSRANTRRFLKVSFSSVKYQFESWRDHKHAIWQPADVLLSDIGFKKEGGDDYIQTGVGERCTGPSGERSLTEGRPIEEESQ